MFSYTDFWNASSEEDTDEEEASVVYASNDYSTSKLIGVAKKRRQLEIVEELSIPRKKGKTVLRWPKNAISMLLKLRLKQCRSFEMCDRDAEAWENISTALNSTVLCTARECRLLFESLLTKFVSLKTQGKADTWEYIEIFEEIFSKSQKLTESYPNIRLDSAMLFNDNQTAKVHFNKVDPLHNKRLLLESFISYQSELALYQSYTLEFQTQCQTRMAELEDITSDLKALQEKNVWLLCKILQKITQNDVNAIGDDQLRLIAKVIPSLLPGCSFCIPPIGNYLQNSALDRDITKSLVLFSSALLTSIRLLLNGNSEEDEFFVNFLSRSKVGLSLQLNDVKKQASLSEFNFKGHLHICRTSVEKLIEIVGPKLKNEKYCKPLSVEKQTIFALWYLVHKETFEQMSIRFSMRLSDVGKVIRTFVNAIAIEVNSLTWPENDIEVEETVKAFENRRKDAFPGVLGAIGAKYLAFSSDGALCAKIDEDPNERIVVQAVADSNYIVKNVFISWVDTLDNDDVLDELNINFLGSKRKITTPKDVFFRSPIGSCIGWQTNHLSSTAKPLNLQSLPDNVHFIGDHTFPLLTSLMVPFGATYQESPSRYLYDIQLHLSRSVIDSTFGRIMSRFQRLSCLDYNLKNHTFDLIKACIGVHNVCLLNEDDFAPTTISLPEIDNYEVNREVSPIAAFKREKLCKAFRNEDVPYVYRSMR